MKKEKDWKIPFARPRITPALEAAGFTPLLTAVLALRGVEDGQQARQLTGEDYGLRFGEGDAQKWAAFLARGKR